MTPPADDFPCNLFVELVTDYLEGALEPGDQARFEQHLEICEPCVAYVEQIRLTIAASGAISEEQLDPEAREELLAVFRGWNRGG